MNVANKLKTKVICAKNYHTKYIPKIIEMIENAARKEGAGLAKRSEEYLARVINEGKAILAFADNNLIGFCYIETWGHEKYVANSGLIVDEKYRGLGVAREIKRNAFEISRKRYPEAKIFGLTTNLAVMRINSSLGYVPVTFSELTSDSLFWKGCETCKYYDIQVRTKLDTCLCTAMVYNPESEKQNEQSFTSI